MAKELKDCPWASMVMPFGKHEGETLGWIAKDDPTYVLWMSCEIRNMRLRELAGEAVAWLRETNPDVFGGR